MKRILIIGLALLMLAGCTAAPGAEPSAALRQKPPALTVISGENRIEATLGTYSWDWPNPDGTRSGVEADGRHPLDMLDDLSPLDADGPELIVRFETKGTTLDRLFIRGWDPSRAGDPESYEANYFSPAFRIAEGQAVVTLPETASGIFEVHACFTGESQGNGYYAFYVRGIEVPQAEGIPFDAQSVRILWREGLCELPQIQVIRDREELSAALQNEEGYESSADLLDELADSCSDAFFAEQELLLLRLEEGSGSISHEVRAVEQGPEGVTVSVRRQVPEICTADMAAWLLFIRVPRGTAGEALSVEIL